MTKKFYSYKGPLLDVVYEKPFGRTKKEYVRAAANKGQAILLLKKAISVDERMSMEDFRLDPNYLNELESHKEKIVLNNDKSNPDDEIQLSWF